MVWKLIQSSVRSVLHSVPLCHITFLYTTRGTAPAHSTVLVSAQLWAVVAGVLWLHIEVELVVSRLGIRVVGTFHLFYRSRRPLGRVEVSLYSFPWTSALDGGGWSTPRPRPPYPRKRPYTLCTGGWVGLGAGLCRRGKSRPHRDSIPGLSSP